MSTTALGGCGIPNIPKKNSVRSSLWQTLSCWSSSPGIILSPFCFGLTSGISTRTTVLHTLVHLVALSLSAINHSYIYIDVYIEKSFKSSKFSAASSFEMGGAMLRPTSWPENRSHRRFARRIRVSS